MTSAIESMVHQLLESEKQPKQDRNAQIIAMSSTMSQYEIAFEMGLSRTQVYNILRAHRQRQNRENNYS